MERWIGIGIGVGMMVLSSLIKQKHMLTISGVGVLAGGIFLARKLVDPSRNLHISCFFRFASQLHPFHIGHRVFRVHRV